MSNKQFHVKQLDHVELFVPDQYEAAEWYQKLFGLEIVPNYEFWAADGPLMISSDGGQTMLALFKGEPPGFQPPIGFQRVAFRVDEANFFAFLQQVAKHGVFTHEGQQTHELEIVDHDLAHSLYFCDPYGNRYEVTTYEYPLPAADAATTK